ncbi:hypothetical protein BFF78_38015 [Streptomyces fodineus]|uniref:DUF485 domain-containing protein n=1 Tax=Streptomyces fodineus TaxID=1904616 RepID=A0A1D7YKK0_9ACTN|nr:DUF485 domain-containing protein [Streptomyces fodineus]AOR36081.1 hypothetical protein BFF78_38015 [Streptomyces fodineus]
MTFADENRYPPSDTGWPPPHGEPGSYAHHTPQYAPYRQAPWNEPYASYGQASWNEPYAYETHRRGADLAALRSAYRLLRRIATLTALGSFVVYVVLSCYAPALMGARIAGELSLGMALGVLQLVVTFAAVFWYGRSAQRSVDPLARAVREQAVPAGGHGGAAR